MRKWNYIALLLVSLVFAVAPSRVLAADKVTLSPATISLTEGQSQEITVTLDEPIIVMEGPGLVTLQITNLQPGRINTSVSSVSWTAAEWSQPRIFTITAIDDTIINGNVSDVIDVNVESDSEYYDGFVPTFTASVLDNDVPTVLPAVGNYLPSIVAVIMAIGLSYVVYSKQRRSIE